MVFVEGEMNTKPSFVRVLILLGVLFFQLVMTQVVTFIASMVFGGFENLQPANKYLFAAAIGFTFSVGSFFAGWVALRFRWLDAMPKYPARAVGTLLGAYIPLLAAVLLYPRLEPGNPLYAVSILSCILGFHVPTWIRGGKSS
jgi:hypothetical protein